MVSTEMDMVGVSLLNPTLNFTFYRMFCPKFYKKALLKTAVKWLDL